MSAKPFLAISNRIRSTPFTSRVMNMGASAFTVYNHMLLPTEFESLEADYWHLCEHVQVWDVGVERQVSLKGPDAQKLLQWMTPRDISNVQVGRCVYVPLADEKGCLVNDPVALKLAEDHWWLSIADSDVLLWAKGLAVGANFDVELHEPNVWPLAVQGPKAEQLMQRIFGESVSDIKFFRFEHREYQGHLFIVARSGWSKQGGFEIYVDNAEHGVQLFDELFDRGAEFNVRPGCPNLIERLESGLLSYGNDMTINDTPLEAGLGSFFNLSENTKALSMPALLKQQEQGLRKKLIGLLIDAPEGATPLAENPVVSAESDNKYFPISVVGSQAWSPRYRMQMATVMLDAPFCNQASVEVQLVDGRTVDAKIQSIPFDFTGLPQYQPMS